MALAVVPFFVSAFRIADSLALAMEARCYIPGARRTALRTYRMGRWDFTLLALLSLITLLLIATA
jgi:energy-coupling factor transporter transmembrane protein EcfT